MTQPGELVIQQVEGESRKRAAIIAEHLEDEIVARGWPIGQVLGSEAELLERYGVSRAVLREAVRIVEHDRAARMRRGPNGGLVVTQPDVSAVVRTVALQLQFQGIDREQLFEARTAVELMCVRKATASINGEGMVRLREYLDREEQFVRGDLAEHIHDFHILVAGLTGNPALRLFVQVLGRLTGQQSLAPPSEDLAQAVHRAHARIGKALLERDADEAERLMLRHLEAVTTWLQAPANQLRQGKPTA